jgi:hypothetical protein
MNRLNGYDNGFGLASYRVEFSVIGSGSFRCASEHPVDHGPRVGGGGLG